MYIKTPEYILNEYFRSLPHLSYRIKGNKLDHGFKGECLGYVERKYNPILEKFTIEINTYYEAVAKDLDEISINSPIIFNVVLST